LKEHLGGHRLQSDEDSKQQCNETTTTQSRGQDSTFYESGIDKLISRLDKCFNRLGVYVEK
ncbi:hypothetical protein AVEN_48363-1, partial [Araneus ventricosus]